MNHEQYYDKNNRIIKDKDYVLVENEIVCQALRCDDGTLLYEELFYNEKISNLDLTDNPNYPDAYNKNEVELISYATAIELLKK